MKTLMSYQDEKGDEDWKLMKLLYLIVAKETEVHHKRDTYTFMVSLFFVCLLLFYALSCKNYLQVSFNGGLGLTERTSTH